MPRIRIDAETSRRRQVTGYHGHGTIPGAGTHFSHFIFINVHPPSLLFLFAPTRPCGTSPPSKNSAEKFGSVIIPRTASNNTRTDPLRPPPRPASPWVGSRSPRPMVGIRSPIGLVVGSCTSHPGVLGSIPKREEPGKTGAPCVKVPGSSRVPVRDERTHPHRPRLVVSHSTCSPLSSSPPPRTAL